MLAAAVFSILVLAFSAVPAFAERAYETQLTGTPTGGGGSEVAFTQPWGVAVDGSDNVWVSDIGPGFVDKFNSSNSFVAQGNGEEGGVKKWTGSYTRGVAYSDAAEKLFVADSNADDVWTTKADGTFEGDIKGEGPTWGSGCCYIYTAADNSAGATAHDVYVTSSGSGETLPAVNRIDGTTGAPAAFSALAEYIKGNQITGTPVGSPAEGPFGRPEGATVDSNGNIYVVDVGKSVIDEFASSGEFIQTFTGLTGTPNAVAVDPTNGNVLVAVSADEAGDVVDEFSSSGEPLGSLTGAETPAGSIGQALGIAVNSSGDVYVSDGPNHVVDVFGPAGAALPKQTLTVEKAGAGGGTVTSSPAGINCGTTCSHGFPEGKLVKLTATPNSKSTFAGWSGSGCSGTGTCEVEMTEAKAVTAEFAAIPQVVLNVEVNNVAEGTVTSSPGGIECGATCSGEFNENSTVTLTASSAQGFRFVKWTGCPSEPAEGVCEVAMTAETTVSAEFEARPKFALNVTGAGTGSGTVTSAPGGISCEPQGAGTCSAEFTEGETVTLTAAPASGSTFVKWTGCTRETGEGACEVDVAAEAAVSAEFSQEAPVVSTEAASGVTSLAATVAGKVNPRGPATSACKFVYGTTTAYGSQAPCSPGQVSGASAQSVQATLSGLAAHTVYHYKLVAANGGGEASGSDATFQTAKSAAELEEEAAIKRRPEEEAAAVKRQQEEAAAARAAQNKLEEEAANKRVRELEAVVKRAQAEEAVVKTQEGGGSGTLELVRAKPGGRSVVLTFAAAHAGSVTISGPGLKKITKSIAAGTHRVTVSLSAAGKRAHARGKRIKITVRGKIGGQAVSLSRTIKL